jgi:hypothetical protein
MKRGQNDNCIGTRRFVMDDNSNSKVEFKMRSITPSEEYMMQHAEAAGVYYVLKEILPTLELELKKSGDIDKFLQDLKKCIFDRSQELLDPVVFATPPDPSER